MARRTKIVRTALGSHALPRGTRSVRTQCVGENDTHKKMLWKTHSGTRLVTFKEQVNLWRYLIYNNRSSDLYYYIKVVLGSLRDMNVAKSMIGNSKYYPYQYLVKNRKVKDKCCQRGYNLLNYKDITNKGKYTQEYIRWLKENRIFNPYVRK